MYLLNEFSTTVEGRAAAAAAAVSLRGKVPYLASYGRTDSGNASRGWIYGTLALPAAGLYGNYSYIFRNSIEFLQHALGSQEVSGVSIYLFILTCTGYALNSESAAESHNFGIKCVGIKWV